MTDECAGMLAKQDALRWLAGVTVGACAINSLDDGLTAARKLPETMAPLWHLAYGRSAFACPPIASPSERMLVLTCFVLSAMYPDDSGFPESIRSSIVTVKAGLDEFVGTRPA